MKWKPYPRYKSSGVEWLGEIPEHWPINKLKHVAAFTGGGTPSKDEPAFWGGSIPWVSPKDMKCDRLVDTEDHITEKAVLSSATSIVPAGTVLMVVRSGILRHTIPVAIAASPLTLNQDMKGLSCRIAITPWFLVRWVQGLQSELITFWSKQGATVESLEHEYIANTLLPTPTIPEQAQISAFLDRETTTIDTLIAKQERLIELLQEKRQALISHAVTKGLNPDSPMKPSGVEWLGDVPSHWEVRKISSFAQKITNGYVGPTRDILVDSGVKYLQSLHIKGNAILFDGEYFVTPEWSRQHAKSILRVDDVLIVQTGDIGQVAVVPGAYAGANCHALIIVTTDKSTVLGGFLAMVLLSTYGKAKL